MNIVEIKYTGYIIAFIVIAIILILIFIQSGDLNFKNFKDFLGTKPGKFIIYTFLSLLFAVSILFIIKGLLIYGSQLFGYQAINAKVAVKSIHKTNFNFINPGFNGLVAFGTILLSMITVYSLFYNTSQEKRNTALLIKSGLEYFKNTANEFVDLYNFKYKDNEENYLRVLDKHITRYSANRKPEFNFTHIFDSVISKLGILNDEKLISNFIKVYEIIKSMETELRDYGEEYCQFILVNKYLLNIYLPLLEEENNPECFVKYDIFHADAKNYFSIKEKSYTYLYDWYSGVQHCLITKFSRFTGTQHLQMSNFQFETNETTIDDDRIYFLQENFSISPFNELDVTKREVLLYSLTDENKIISIKFNSNGQENILLILYNTYDNHINLLNKYSFENILSGIKPLCLHTSEIFKLVNSINIDEIIKDLDKIIK